MKNQYKAGGGLPKKEDLDSLKMQEEGGGLAKKMGLMF